MVRCNDDKVKKKCKIVQWNINKNPSTVRRDKGSKRLPEAQSTPTLPQIQPVTALARNVFERPDGYYKYTKGMHPDLKRVSNVILRAVTMVKNQEGWFLSCDVIRNGRPDDITRIILSGNDFQGGDTFKRALSQHGMFEYYGNSSDTTEILGILTEQNPKEMVGLKTHGIHSINGRPVYVEGNRVIDAKGTAEGIVSLQSDSGSNEISTLLCQRDIAAEELAEIGSRLYRFNDRTITLPILGFIGYCYLKSRLSDQVNQRNPILMLQGEPGSGKSETISRIIQPIFCSGLPLTNIADCTEFTAAMNSSSTNMVPMCYDEWKLATVSKPQKRVMDRMLLATFSGTPLQRGHVNNSVSNFRFSAPMILAGEMRIDSPSLRHRMVDLFFSGTKRIGTETCFHELAGLPLGAFGKGLLLHSLGLSNDRIHSEFHVQKTGVDPRLDARFRDNAALIRTGLWFITDFFRTHNIAIEEYASGYSIIDSVIHEMLKSSKITNVERTIEDFNTMATQKFLIRNEDFGVKGNVLRLKIADVFAKYERWFRRHATAEFIGKHSFLQQIADKPYFRGKKTVRIGGIESNGIELDLTEMPEDVSMDSFHEDSSSANSLSEEGDSDTSSQQPQKTPYEKFLSDFNSVPIEDIAQTTDPCFENIDEPDVSTSKTEDIAQTTDTCFGNIDEPDVSTSSIKDPIPNGWIEITDQHQTIVPGDEVEYWEGVYDGKYPNGLWIGRKQVVARVLKESFGTKDGHHRLKMEVLSSEGKNPFEAGKRILRREQSLYRYYSRTIRKAWADENDRLKAIETSNRLFEENSQRRIKESANPRPRRKSSVQKPANPESEDDGSPKIYNLSEAEKNWVEHEWYRDIEFDKHGKNKLEKWILDSKWIQLSGECSTVIVGDVIQFFNPNFSGRYPNGKFRGCSIVIAEVVKIGREYYHLRSLACSGSTPWRVSKGTFKRRFGIINHWISYRLRWQNEGLRRSRLEYQ
jgi:hypothetical protein